MIYKDGSPMDKDMRLIECPRCHNTEFSKDANFCRICGLALHNTCEGDEYDNRHNNPSNARYCETCGAKTRFLIEGILKKYTEVDASLMYSTGHNDEDEPDEEPVSTVAPTQEVSDDELPF